MRRPAEGPPCCYHRSILTSSITSGVLLLWPRCSSVYPRNAWHHLCKHTRTADSIRLLCCHTSAYYWDLIFMFLDTWYLEGCEQEAIWRVITEVNSMKCNCSSLFSLFLHPREMPSGPATITITHKKMNTQLQCSYCCSVTCLMFNLDTDFTSYHRTRFLLLLLAVAFWST